MFKEENFEKINTQEDTIKSESEKLKEWNRKQIKLAIELFEFITKTKIDLENKEETRSAMEYWIEEGYSTLYRELEKENVSEITPEDIIEYKKSGTLLNKNGVAA